MITVDTDKDILIITQAKGQTAMENSVETPKSLYVYPLPAKTQGEHGNSKAYSISLVILLACILALLSGIILSFERIDFLYICTALAIALFILYFCFYKSSIFIFLLLLSIALIVPAFDTAAVIIDFIPRLHKTTRWNEAYIYIEANIAIGIAFFFFFHIINYIIELIFMKSIKLFITPVILCGMGSFSFYFFSAWLVGLFIEFQHP